MLDPHIRTALPPVPGKPGQYEVSFRVPDRHGVFKFVIDYKRKGCVFIVLRWIFCESVLTSRQMDTPTQLDCRPRSPAAARRVSALPQCGMAVLRGRGEHQRGLCALRGALARGR